ncbi:hypothetical protein PMAYCL1PPCAC_21716, partial [Pristionchus mayeri]
FEPLVHEPIDMVDDIADSMSDLPFHMPTPQHTMSQSYVQSQQTMLSEVTSETGVLCDPPTTKLRTDYVLVKMDCLLSLFSRCHECGMKEIKDDSFKSHTVGSALCLIQLPALLIQAACAAHPPCPNKGIPNLPNNPWFPPPLELLQLRS